MRYYGIKIQENDSDNVIVRNMNAENLSHLIERLDNDSKIKSYEIPEKYKVKNSLYSENNSDKNNILDTTQKMEENSEAKQSIKPNIGNFDERREDSNSEHEEPIFEPKKETFSEKVKSFFNKKNEQFQDDDYFDFDKDFEEEVFEPKNHDPDVIGALLAPILTTLMSVFNNIFNREIFSKIDFSKSETKQIKDSFISAFPDTKINPKVSFFTTILIIIGGKLNIKNIIDKNEKE